MKRWNQIALALCVAAATTACAGDRPADDTAPAGTDRPVGTSGREANAPMDVGADREFVDEMMADGKAEVELGRLVQQKSKNRDVRQFAAMMIEDHTKAGTELKQVATRANITTTGDKHAEDHNELRERLGKLSGAEFDREYIKAMVDDHQDAVDAVENKADGAQNDHVKQWAAQTLPTLKKHLEQAKQIQEKLGS
jgi:putative membrane protein